MLSTHACTSNGYNNDTANHQSVQDASKQLINAQMKWNNIFTKKNMVCDFCLGQMAGNLGTLTSDVEMFQKRDN